MSLPPSHWFRRIGKWYLLASAIIFQGILFGHLLPYVGASEEEYFRYYSQYSSPENGILLFRGSEAIFAGLNEIYVFHAPEEWIEMLLQKDPWPGASWEWKDIVDVVEDVCYLPEEKDQQMLKALLPPGRYRYADATINNDFWREFLINEKTGMVMFCASD